ncbi:MAG: hypothetical protein JJE21_09275 [Spirochaetaceae bacterium]|nr:hypothetical protein [Spirochaetaceae bacterium]
MTTERLWDRTISREEYDESSGIIEGTKSFVKAARRASYGFNDYDYFVLLISYKTHEDPRKRNNYCSEKTTISYKRTKAHNRRFDKERLYTSPRNENGKYMFF